ncbi:MAG: hypothetical protein GQ531_10325 [Sulfurovum sp.]|nr:hypothetical protein [Sulfurovum sp.]
MRVLWVFVLLTLHSFAWQLLGFGTETREKEVTIRTVLPMDVEYEKGVARSHLNDIRESMGMNTLLQDDLLNLAAQGHADYLVANNESSHYEVEGHKKFIGVKPVDRTLSVNYQSTQVSENLSTHTYDAQSSIDGLFSAIYHRFGFLALDIDTIGVGTTQEKSKTSNSAFVYVMANSNLERFCHDKSFSGSGKYYYKMCKNEDHRIGEKAYHKALDANKRYNPKIVLYPYDGQKEVPPVFYDESPDPLPNHEVSGFPVSVEFNDYFFKEVSLQSFKLFENEGSEVTDVLLMNKDNDPHQRFTSKQFSLFPLKRLEYDTEYRAEIAYSVKGKLETLSWAFVTQKPTESLHKIETKDATLHLEKGKSHILYFPPHNAHDLLKQLQFPADVDITFIDHNTLKLTVMDEDLDDFTMKSEGRNIRIVME